jgi:hypothetical protein
MRVFLVQGSTGERATEILGAAGLPRVNRDAHPANPYMLCKRKSPERLQGARNLWSVVCTYDTTADSATGGGAVPQGDGGQDPFQWDADIEIGADQIAVAVFEDADGVAVQNAAGTPYEGGLQKPKALPIVRLTQYEPATVDVISKIKTYANTRNSDMFLQSGDEGKWLCRDIRASRVRVSAELAWRVSYEMAFDEDKHVVTFPNAGPQVREIGDDLQERVAAYLDPVYKQPAITNLTPAGFVLADGDAPNFKTFQPYSQVAWSPLKMRRRRS